MTAEVVFRRLLAGCLTSGAFALEWLSSHTHRRRPAVSYRRIHVRREPRRLALPARNAWPQELDRERRLVRYRARAPVCNACPAKHQCTDSDPHGREVVRSLDPWPHSETGRFHRVIALMLVALAGLILVVEIARNHSAPEAALVLGLLLPIALAARWLVRDLRAHPARFRKRRLPGLRARALAAAQRARARRPRRSRRGSGDHRVEVELGDLGEVLGELREPVERDRRARRRPPAARRGSRATSRAGLARARAPRRRRR